MKNASFKKYGFIIQICFWIILFAGELSDELLSYSLMDSLIGTTIQTIYTAIAVYTHFAFLYFLVWKPGFEWRKFSLYAFMAISLPVITTYLCYNTYELIFPDFADFISLFSYKLIMIPYFVVIIATSAMYLFIKSWYDNIRIKANLKSEKLDAELDFLKAQINPHFLFNTLNNIYSYAVLKDERTPEMVEKLSSMLRYMVYDSSNLVSLKKEVKVIQDIIGLYQVKNTEQNNIRFQYSGEISSFKIAPLILINFVENAFKHSDVLSGKLGYVHIKLNVSSNGNLDFEVSNSRKLEQSHDGGVGLENIRKRLDIMYKGAYSLAAKPQKQSYTLKLKLNLNESV